jgi:hypothetical protein
VVGGARHGHEVVGQHSERLQKRRQHGMAGHHQADAEYDQRHAFVH